MQWSGGLEEVTLRSCSYTATAQQYGASSYLHTSKGVDRNCGLTSHGPKGHRPAMHNFTLVIETLILLLLGIVIILVIIAANGYFVAQEFAYMSVDRNRLGARAAAVDASAVRALAVTKRTSFMLSGAQLGITVTGLLVGFVAQPLIGESLGVLLGGLGVSMGVSVTLGTVIALALATVVQMIFGELYPKNLAIANPEP
jgi:hypothetical protein